MSVHNNVWSLGVILWSNTLQIHAAPASFAFVTLEELDISLLIIMRCCSLSCKCIRLLQLTAMYIWNSQEVHRSPTKSTKLPRPCCRTCSTLQPRLSQKEVHLLVARQITDHFKVNVITYQALSLSEPR